jgi:hypothetical protein
VPAELAPTVRPACDLAKFTGTYAVVESGHIGGCSNVFSDATVVVNNGELVPTGLSCQSQLTAWSPDTCRAESATTCASDALSVTWNLALTDLLTDGSKLVGTGSVTMLGPVACEAVANLQLTRR